MRQKDPFPLGVERGGVLYRGTARLGRRSRGRCGLRERVFAVLIVRHSSTKRARFLCDGVFSLYLSLLFNLAAYRLFALETGDSWMMAVGFLLLLFGCVLAFLFITFRNIKKGVFSKEPTAKQTAILPAAGGAVGVLAARFLLTGQPQQTVFRLTGALLLILSLLISIPGINILKAVLCKE